MRPRRPLRSRRLFNAAAIAAAAVAGFCAGCQQTTDVALRDELAQLRETVKQRDNDLAARDVQVRELNKQLAVARSISEDDLKRVYYPEQIAIGRLSGGYDIDGQPGHDGVVVYLQPIDRAGDVIKVPGDVTIQLYDLAAEPGRNFLGEYMIPVDKIGALWFGKLMTNHYTIRCPFANARPQNSEVTVRVIFVDYLTKRVVTAQSAIRVELPPGGGAPAAAPAK